MDQLVIPIDGFLPTHRGNLIIQRYPGATVFVDHFSDYTYVHSMTEIHGKTTVAFKKAFERIAANHNVKISHYHSDNGIFYTKLFKDSIHKSE